MKKMHEAQARAMQGLRRKAELQYVPVIGQEMLPGRHDGLVTVSLEVRYG
jgi:hypothetical protein